MLNRKQLAFYLEDIETPTGRTVSLIITGLILLSSASFIAETYPLSASMRMKFQSLDTVLLVVFVVEYLLRLWCAENKFRFIFSLFSIVDLLAILPFLLGFVNVSFIRIFRWFRILRLIRFLELKISVFRISSEDGAIFARIMFTLLAIVFVYSGLIYQVEHPTNPQSFGTFLDAVYFSVVTMTTVGFGDVTPISESGRFLTILMILTGIALIPWQLGDLIKQLVKTTDRVDNVCQSCGWSVHDADAKFCKMCGTRLGE
ncbi:MAG: ion transporter [Oscillatoriaceae cyanobacterium Prado104]|jgi:voltage-gated potassium channel|nr:ion transporter [Oscillatoriaceae cyanobacterium Prado104]